MQTVTSASPLPLSATAYHDKVLGGWVGKCAGGILGAPIEGYKVFNNIPLSDNLFKSNFANDDLDLQVLWLDMVAKKGPHVRAADFTEHWQRHVAFPWNEYGIASRNIALGLDLPDTGRHNNWYWQESMGSPIRSEIWGMLFPGDPQRAAFYAKLDSELDHVGFSVHAEQFFSACAALAFVETDLNVIIDRARQVIPTDGVCHELIGRIADWYRQYGFTTTAGKIKSYYGDADFTSAPMNVGFTILSMLHAAADFDRIIEALHLGHDSDCVVATAAAILGILSGNDQLPAKWKERVGNELLISPEISGIRCPPTLTELTEWTCEVGRKIADGWPAPERGFALRTEVLQFPQPASGIPLRLALVVENLTASALPVTVRLTSEYFSEAAFELVLPPDREERREVVCPLQSVDSRPATTAYPYQVSVTVGGERYLFERGVPNYGAWLLLGPFIREDRRLAPMDPNYPDHGMSSLPSVTYMNHDRVNGPDEDFLTHPAITSLLDGNDRESQDFAVTTVHPTAMSIDLGDYFYGRGERTLYLTTRIEATEASRQWLCLGSTGYLTVWLNGERVLQSRELHRRWPATRVADLQLVAGQNTLTIRIDTVTDDYRLDVGLKDHAGRHHHQSHWNTTLAFSSAP